MERYMAHQHAVFVDFEQRGLLFHRCKGLLALGFGLLLLAKPLDGDGRYSVLLFCNGHHLTKSNEQSAGVTAFHIFSLKMVTLFRNS